MEVITTKKDAKVHLTSTGIGRNYWNQLFHIEQRLKELSIEERKAKRLELEKQVLDAFWCWVESLHTLKRACIRESCYLCDSQKTIYGKLSFRWKMCSF